MGQFRYGESHKMKSQILQMPFKDSNISMLIIMPYDINGINRLEKKLKNFDLNEVAMRALRHEVDVSLPKFKIESDINLKEPLMKVNEHNFLKYIIYYIISFLVGSHENL